MDNNSRKKKKRKYHHYYLNVTSNPSIPAKESRLSTGSRRFWIVFGVILLILAFGFVAYENYISNINKTREKDWRQQVVDLTNERDELSKENSRLKEKIDILSHTVNAKVQVEQQFEEKSIPSGFPMSGAVDYEEKEMELTLNGEIISIPLLEFSAEDGEYAVASGNGVVKYSGDEPVYGYEVQIDHGNGYVSVYITNTKPKVKEGDDVTRGSILFEMKSGNDDKAKMVYQIMSGVEYENPADYLEIQG